MQLNQTFKVSDHAKQAFKARFPMQFHQQIAPYRDKDPQFFTKYLNRLARGGKKSVPNSQFEEATHTFYITNGDITFVVKGDNVIVTVLVGKPKERKPKKARKHTPRIKERYNRKAVMDDVLRQYRESYP